jgi:hypothetical protein
MFSDFRLCVLKNGLAYLNGHGPFFLINLKMSLCHAEQQASVDFLLNGEQMIRYRGLDKETVPQA